MGNTPVSVSFIMKLMWRIYKTCLNATARTQAT